MLQEIYNEEVGEYSFFKFKGFDLLLNAPFTNRAFFIKTYDKMVSTLFITLL